MYQDKKKPDFDRSFSGQNRVFSRAAVLYLFHGSIDHEPPNPQTPEGNPTGPKPPSGATSESLHEGSPHGKSTFAA